MELKHEAEERETRVRPRGFIHVAGAASLNEDLALCRQIEQPEEVQERAFSRSRGAGDGDEFAGPNGEIDFLDERDGDDTLDHLGDAAHLDQRCFSAGFRAMAGRRHDAPRMMSTGCTRAALRAGK
jgi:hypothetical protein